MMTIDPDWLKKLIASKGKEREATKDTLKICEEALERSLEPHLIWLEGKNRAEKELRELDRSLERLKKLSKKKV